MYQDYSTVPHTVCIVPTILHLYLFSYTYIFKFNFAIHPHTLIKFYWLFPFTFSSHLISMYIQNVRTRRYGTPSIRYSMLGKWMYIIYVVYHPRIQVKDVHIYMLPLLLLLLMPLFLLFAIHFRFMSFRVEQHSLYIAYTSCTFISFFILCIFMKLNLIFHKNVCIFWPHLYEMNHLPTFHVYICKWYAFSEGNENCSGFLLPTLWREITIDFWDC